MTIPDDLGEWPDGQRLQWLADELWLAATGDETPAPPSYVQEVGQLVGWLLREPVRWEAAERA